MRTFKVVTLTLDDRGHMNILPGDGLTPADGLQLCQAARDWFQEQAIRAEVERRQVYAEPQEVIKSDSSECDPD